MDKKDIVIVIPAYRKPDVNEGMSLRRCLDVLGDYDIIAAMPEKAMVTPFGDELLDSLKHEYFPDIYFESIAGYNRLVLSDTFYRRFSKYEYLLIYQLDAYVFHDSLLQWAEKGYDYVGAPWMPVQKHHKNLWSMIRLRTAFAILSRLNRKILRTDVKYMSYQVGNGGLSLRKTSKFLYITTEFRKRIDNLLDVCGKMYPEDLLLATEFCSGKGALLKPGFRTALKFSVEMDPGRSMMLNGNKLPFGCHAWSHPAYNDFWKEIIRCETRK